MIKLTEKFGARGIKVPWEGVFQFQSKPTWSMLEIFPGVSKKPELRPTCLWVMPQSPTQRDLSSLVINTPKLESANTRLLTLANFPHMKDHFYFLTWNFLTPIEPCLDILLTRNVWQLKSLKHLPMNHFGRWHSPQRSLRNQNPKLVLKETLTSLWTLGAVDRSSELLGRVCCVWRSSARELGHKIGLLKSIIIESLAAPRYTIILGGGIQAQSQAYLRGKYHLILKCF